MLTALLPYIDGVVLRAGCVLTIKPPMCLSRASADFFVRAPDTVLSAGW